MAEDDARSTPAAAAAAAVKGLERKRVALAFLDSFILSCDTKHRREEDFPTPVAGII